MAVINVIQPRFGWIEVISTAIDDYRVKYHYPAQSIEWYFGGFKVYCHQCEHDVYAEDADELETVSIDFTEIMSSGDHIGPFDISAYGAYDEDEITVNIRTRPNDPSLGTTNPELEQIVTQLGKKVSCKITATPNPGCAFVKWKREPFVGPGIVDSGWESTRNPANPSFTPTSSRFKDRTYTAYFERVLYRSVVEFNFTSGTSSGIPRFNSGSVSKTEISDYVTVRDRVDGATVNVNVALVSKSVLNVYRGEQVTFTVQVLPEAETYGVKFLGWVAGDHTAEDGLVVYGNSITVTNMSSGTGTGSQSAKVKAWFGFGGNMATVKFVRPEYYHPAGLPTARSWDGVAAGSSSLGNPDVYDKDAAIYTWRFRDGDLYIWWDGPTDALAVVHGSSSARCEIGEWTVPGEVTPATIKITPSASAAGEEFVVYLCTHLLVCTDDGAHLECKPPQLLYDCSRAAS